MKKVLFAGLVVAGVSVMTSCKKDYTCTYDSGSGSDTVLEYNDLTKDQASAAKTSCSFVSGTWADA